MLRLTRAPSLILVLLLCLSAFSECSAYDGDRFLTDYRAHWVAAATALAAFSYSDLRRKPNAFDFDRLSRQLSQERDRLASNLAWLSTSLPPKGAALQHWELLPLYEDALSAVTIICDAAARHDEAGFSAGSTIFSASLRTLHDATTRLTSGLNPATELTIDLDQFSGSPSR